MSELPVSQSPALTVPEMLCFALYSATHAMQRAYAPLLEELDLTYPQYLTLSTLWGEDGQTVGRIARTLQLDSNTLTPLLKRMEAQGLLTRKRDTADERQVRICLTDKGKSLKARAAHIPGCFLEQTGLTLESVPALRDQVMALRDQLRKFG